MAGLISAWTLSMALASSLTSSEQKVFIVEPPNKKPHPCLRHGWGLVKVEKSFEAKLSQLIYINNI
jgi:hypothetical protein